MCHLRVLRSPSADLAAVRLVVSGVSGAGEPKGNRAVRPGLTFPDIAQITSKFAIIAMSSCSALWQWKT